MEEFVLSPPRVVLYVLVAVMLVAVASILLKKGPAAKKVIGLVVTVLALGVVAFFVYRPVTITVDEAGVVVTGTAAVGLDWAQVNSAVFEPDLANSGFRPTVRTRGVAVGAYRTGRFLLSNGQPARLFMEQQKAAVVLQTDELTYLLAPSNPEELAEAINTYRTYETEDAQ
jgi:hypothetical protein